jgi:hypothetical protein
MSCWVRGRNERTQEFPKGEGFSGSAWTPETDSKRDTSLSSSASYPWPGSRYGWAT